MKLIHMQLQRWKEKGFVWEHVFPGEYVLLMHPKTLERVRIYDNGVVWIQNTQTGVYKIQTDVECIGDGPKRS